MVVHKKYKLEREMCEELVGWSAPSGWIAYPEQGGWDLLLVRRGVQFGVQTKLRPTVKLMSQALSNPTRGPHYRAVAVGNMDYRERLDFERVAKACHLVPIDMSCHHSHWLDSAGNRSKFYTFIQWRHYRWFPEETIWIPPFVPKHAAGVPSPRTVSPWMVAAVKMELLFRSKGWVTIEDARSILEQEIPNCKDSYARTLLQTYFKCTGEKVPGLKRCKKWTLTTYKRHVPSRKYKHIVEAILKKGDTNA